MTLFVLGPPDGPLEAISIMPHLETFAGSGTLNLTDCHLEDRQVSKSGRTSCSLHIHLRSLPEQTVAHAGGTRVILDRAAAPSEAIPGRSV